MFRRFAIVANQHKKVSTIMDRKDYNKCQSSNELFAFALQNAIIKALKSDIRVN